MPRPDDKEIEQPSFDRELETAPPFQYTGGGDRGNSEDFALKDLRIAANTVRLWRHGVRVANGKGFFAAPRPSDKPTKNSDYLRMFVDEAEGVGVISNPMTDELWFEATGDQPTDGNLIMKLKGPGSVGSSNTGIVDLFSVLILLTASGAPSTVESSGLFDFEGAAYWNSTSKVIRIYDGTAWKTITPT